MKPLLPIALVLALAGCASDGSSHDPITKDDVADVLGKADAFSEKLCVDLGQPPDCDLCEVMGWYDDGVCDDFCPEPDPECDECTGYLEALEMCLDEHFSYATCTVPAAAGEDGPEVTAYDRSTASACCDRHPVEYCGLVDPSVDVEATAIEVPEALLPLTESAATFGVMHVDAQGERYEQPLLNTVFAHGHELFGEPCDGVFYNGTVTFHQNSSVDSLLSFLGSTALEGWGSALTLDEISALEGYVDTAGRDRFVAFYANDPVDHDCLTDELNESILWDTTTDDVIYLVMYREREGSPPDPTSDGLKVLTWNLENFPHSSGALSAAIGALREVDADLIGVEEIAEPTAFQQLVDALDGYEGMLNDDDGYIRVGLIWRTDRLVLEETDTLFPYDWYAFPRPPLMARMALVDDEGGVDFDFTAVVVHLKAQLDQDSMDRRRAACEELDGWITSELEAGEDPDIMIMGDWNDSLTDTGSYLVFDALLGRPDVTFLTLELNRAGAYTCIPFRSFLDHVLVTNDALGEYGDGTTVVLPLETQISDYEDVLTDHRPVLATFEIP